MDSEGFNGNGTAYDFGVGPSSGADLGDMYSTIA